jgi:hypothetical protein
MTTVKDRLITFKNSLVTAKNNLATAITAKGVSASGSDSFATLKNKISSLNIVPSTKDYDIFTYFVAKYWSQARIPTTGIQLVSLYNTSFMAGTNSSSSNYINLSTNIANNGFRIDVPSISGYSSTNKALLSYSLLINIDYFDGTNNPRSPGSTLVYGVKGDFCPVNNDWNSFASVLNRKVLTNNFYNFYSSAPNITPNDSVGSYNLTALSNPYLSGIDSVNTYFYLKPVSNTTTQLFAHYQLWATFARQKT